jgi:hypothetical protein
MQAALIQGLRASLKTLNLGPHSFLSNLAQFIDIHSIANREGYDVLKVVQEFLDYCIPADFEFTMPLKPI